jgi:hypothetical protein
MKAALKAVVPFYKDFNIDMKHIVIRREPQCLFHFRDEIKEYGSSLQDTEAAKHVLYLLQYMYSVLSTELYSWFSHMEVTGKPRALDFMNLWMAFRPGDILYVKGREKKGHQTGWAFRFRIMERCRCTLPWCPNSRWKPFGDHIEYNGTLFGHCTVSFEIKSYDGFRPLHELPVVPLKYHLDSKNIRDRLIRRGDKFVKLHGSHHRYYNGIANLLGGDRYLTVSGEEDEFPIQKTLVRKQQPKTRSVVPPK